MKNDNETDIDFKMRNRMNWLKVYCIGLLITILSYKLLTSQNFSISNLDFSDLLSLLLALFSIGISVAFYLKATETSNTFYDNTYKFTQDTSQILGRIEERFGQKLDHLDQGYTGVSQQLDRLASIPDPRLTQESIEHDEAELKMSEKQRNDLINSILEKAKLEEPEKDSFIKQLIGKDGEIQKLKEQINNNNRLVETYKLIEPYNDDMLPMNAIYILYKFVKLFNANTLVGCSSASLTQRFKTFVKELDESSRLLLIENGIMNKKYDLYKRGIAWIRILVERDKLDQNKFKDVV